MTASTGSRARLRLLLIEDNDDDAEAFARDLGEAVEITRVATLPAASAILLRQPRFDLVVTDLTIAGASGLEVPELAREAPVVAWTGSTLRRDRHEAASRGFADYWRKDVVRGGFLRLIERVLERRARDG